MINLKNSPIYLVRYVIYIHAEAVVCVGLWLIIFELTRLRGGELTQGL